MTVYARSLRSFGARGFALLLALAFPVLAGAPLDASGGAAGGAPEVRSVLAASPAWSRSGLQGKFVVGFAAASATTLYASAAGELYKSLDGGATWAVTGSGTASFGGPIVVDPVNPQIVYASSSLGIVKTTNGGISWTVVSNGLAELGIASLAIDPRNPATIYAGIGGEQGIAIFKTTDAGASWHPSGNGVQGYSTIVGIVIDPQNTSTLYVAVDSRGIYRSTDGGASWTFVTQSISNGWYVLALAMHPTTPTTLYGGFGALSPSDVGLYATSNGGTNWTPQSRGLVLNVQARLAFHPADPRIIFAGDWGDGVVQSSDGGVNWSPINDGLTVPFLLVLTAVPGSQPALFAGTNDGIFKLSLPAGPVPTVSTATPTQTLTPTPTLTPTATLTPTLTPTVRPGAMNLLQNPSFELADGKGFPASWFFRPTAFRDTTVHHGDAASLRLEGPVSGQVGVYTFQPAALTAGRTYEITAWVKAQNLTGSGVRVRYAQVTPSNVTWDTPTMDGTVDWTQVRKTFTLPANYQSGRFDVYWNMKPGDRAWVDDVVLRCVNCP